MALRDRIIFNKGAFKSPNVWLKIVNVVLFLAIFFLLAAQDFTIGRSTRLGYASGIFFVGMAVGGMGLVSLTILISHIFNNQPWLLNASGIEMWQNFFGFIVCIAVGIVGLVEYSIYAVDIGGERQKQGVVWAILLVINAIVMLADGIFALVKYYRLLGIDPRTGEPYPTDEPFDADLQNESPSTVSDEGKP